MSNATINKAEIVSAHARSTNDTGSPEVQVAILTARINDLTPHLDNRRENRGSRSSIQIYVQVQLSNISSGVHIPVPDRLKEERKNINQDQSNERRKEEANYLHNMWFCTV